MTRLSWLSLQDQVTTGGLFSILLLFDYVCCVTFFSSSQARFMSQHFCCFPINHVFQTGLGPTSYILFPDT